MLHEQRPLRVCIDARLISGTSGGVEQVIIGLASALSKLDDGDEEYLFLAYEGEDAWLKPLVGGACRMFYSPAATLHPGWARSLKKFPKVRVALRKLLSLLRKRSPQLLTLPRSDGTLESSGVEVMHFTLQSAFLTDVPSIYQPHDLQHAHLPEFFTAEQRALRDFTYRAFCEQARMVVAMTSWGKRDLIEHFNLPEDKVRIVPWAPVIHAYASPTQDDLAAAQLKFRLPCDFVFYPAQTWPHKNHIKLLEAIALLRDRHGLIVSLVASGHRNDFYTHIEQRARELKLTDQVRFPGFVTPLELQCLYKLCRGVVFPSKFEGWGMPLTEAFLAGAPVACSNATSLPDLVADAGLIFNPDDVEEMADAIRRLWTNEALRQTLVGRGRKRVALFSWDHTARLFRAHYRRTANRPLTGEDRAILAAPPLL